MAAISSLMHFYMRQLGSRMALGAVLALWACVHAKCSAADPIDSKSRELSLVELSSYIGGFETKDEDRISIRVQGIYATGLYERIDLKAEISILTALDGKRLTVTRSIDSPEALDFLSRSLSAGSPILLSHVLSPGLSISREALDRWVVACEIDGGELANKAGTCKVVLSSKDVQTLHSLLQKANSVVEWIGPKVQAFNAAAPGPLPKSRGTNNRSP